MIKSTERIDNNWRYCILSYTRFYLYRDAITKIITQSYPKFSIGIYSDWGIGKTTLMQSIFNQLGDEKEKKDDSIKLIWFNAWWYEREDHFAIIPLLKTIESAISSEKYTNLKEVFKEAGLFGLRTSKDIFSSIIETYLGKETGDILKWEKNISAKLVTNLLYVFATVWVNIQLLKVKINFLLTWLLYWCNF
jgi:hypothetical protein